MPVANTKSSDRWLRTYKKVAAPRLRLVCLPHAGGTAHAYRSWPTWLPPDVELLSVQYPGRQDRLGEPCVAHVDELVAPVADCLRPFVDEPLVIFGHSMGASIAYELTAELERVHGPVVDLLVVSGSLPPHRRDPRPMHTAGDAELIEDLKRLDESFAEVLQAPDLVELLLPTIRADYRLSETYLREDAEAVRAPMIAAGGDSDPDVTRADLESWATVSAGPFDVTMFPGGHFYLADDERTVVSALASRLP